MGNHISYVEHVHFHQFTWHQATRQSINAWLSMMSRIRSRDRYIGQLLLDFSEIQLPPVRDMAFKARRWLQQHPPLEQPATVAILYAPGNMPFLLVARSYATTLGRGRNVTLRFFTSDERTEAEQWLIGDRAGDAYAG